MKDQANFRNMAVACLTILVLGIPGLSSADEDSDFSRIFIFGDSLSDTGNVYILGGQMTSQPPYEVIPTFPYDFQGFQYSNGKTWAQRFAKHLELKRSGKAALRRPGRFTNYAFGGATARYAGNMRSGPEQLLVYMNDFPGGGGGGALYVIQFGGNDIRAALESPAPSAILGMAIASEINMILQLYQQGARQFLVANVPDLSLSPAIKLQDAIITAPPSPIPPGAIIQATSDLVIGYNFGLEFALTELEQMFGDISIKRLDFYSILNDISTNPGNYRITNTDSACVSFGVIQNPICDKPNKYLFWDGIHPTKKVHRIVGAIAADLYDDDDDDDDDRHHKKDRHHDDDDD